MAMLEKTGGVTGVTTSNYQSTPTLQPGSMEPDNSTNRRNLALSYLALVVEIVAALFISIFRTIFSRPLSPVKGNIVLVTGAGHGIGKELALQYGKLGAVVICVDVNEKNNEETAQILKLQNIEAYAFQCNVTDKKEVFDLLEKVQKEVGEVNILINNAGVLVAKNLLDHSQTDVTRTFDVNIISHFWMMQAFLPGMIKSEKGHVVAIASSGGLAGVGNVSAYSATKFAVRGLMEAAAEEAKCYGWKVKFTTICPFFVNTGMCTTENIKVKWLLKVLSTNEVASSIIEAQRRSVREISLPKFLRPSLFLMHLLPDDVQNVILKFSGVTISAKP